jgi:hypothetical protein
MRCERGAQPSPHSLGGAQRRPEPRERSGQIYDNVTTSRNSAGSAPAAGCALPSTCLCSHFSTTSRKVRARGSAAGTNLRRRGDRPIGPRRAGLIGLTMYAGTWIGHRMDRAHSPRLRGPPSRLAIIIRVSGVRVHPRVGGSSTEPASRAMISSAPAPRRRRRIGPHRRVGQDRFAESIYRSAVGANFL